MRETSSKPDVNVHASLHGFNALMLALKDKELVKDLIRAGANVNARNSEGTTVLMLATGADHQESVQELLNSGADVNACHPMGITALALAEEIGNKKLQEMLIAA